MMRPLTIVYSVAILLGLSSKSEAATDPSNHWSYRPITTPTLPTVKNPSQVRNGIDHFILRKLDQETISPSPEANRSALVRRAYLDLIGLPPSPEEWHRWMNEPAEIWYDTMILHLLASPHYGERWGRFWLDQARYADTDGYEKDSPRPHAFQWRDWVIDALNADLPFDQFTEQQIAGDLLPGASDKTKTATGFNRNTLTNKEGGIDKEEDRDKQVVDRINTVSTVWLGLTVKCAQCHDHKYDAIAHREYFQLYAFFNNADEKDHQLPPTPAQQDAFNRATQQHQVELKKVELELQQTRSSIQKELPEFISQLLKDHPQGIAKSSSKGLLAHLTFDDTATRENVSNQDKAIFKGSGKPELTKGIKGNSLKFNGKDQRLELSSDVPFPIDRPLSLGAWIFHNGGIGSIITKLNEDDAFKGIDFTSLNGLLEIHLVNHWPDNSIKVTTTETVKKGEWHHVLMTYDGSGKAAGVAVYIDAKKQKLKVHYDQLTGSFEIDQPIRVGSRRRGAFFNGMIDDVRIYNRVVSSQEIATLGSDSRLMDILSIAALPLDKHTEEQTNTLIDYIISRRDKPKAIQKRFAELKKNLPKVQRGNAMTLVERESPRSTFIHKRGDFLKKGDQVHPMTPAFLPELKPRGPKPDRLDLARWIIRRDNPLTARVTVNRVWQQYFGRGIVPSSDDFGSQGDRPSHPELLDWLASQFTGNNWSLKKLHFLITTSATYRQSANSRPELAARDPYNTWLARQSRLRVEAETVWDLALATSGLLDRRVKGPSVYPPLPPGIIELAFVDVIDRHPWRVSQGGDRYRRGLYTFFQRTSPYPMLTLFDAPDSNTACTRREQSNTPLQALTLWNDPVFMEAAAATAKRIIKATPNKSIDERIRHAVTLCLSRTPTDPEINDILTLYRQSHEIYQANPNLIDALIGKAPPPPGLSKTDLAAWITVCRALLNLDEFITRG